MLDVVEHVGSSVSGSFDTAALSRAALQLLHFPVVRAHQDDESSADETEED
jgi:hypothetical protein